MATRHRLSPHFTVEEFDCDDGRLVWFAGGHTPNQVPVAAGASGRIVCVRGAQRERLFLPGIGWGCAH